MTELKKFADDLGMHYIGKDFDFKLKKYYQIKQFEIGHITVDKDGNMINISLYEDGLDNKVYNLTLDVILLISPAYYTKLDKPGIEKIAENQYLTRARLRIQSLILDIYQQKESRKKNQVFRTLIYLQIKKDGTLIWA